jgi:hypothetical protein
MLQSLSKIINFFKFETEINKLTQIEIFGGLIDRQLALLTHWSKLKAVFFQILTKK